MKDILNQLYEGKKLTKTQAKDTLIGIASGNYNNSQVASFITSFLMRNIAVEELEGFREALLELCIHTDLSAYDPMDLCGTGGDGKNAFNISTISSFVVAASGVHVAKHGNYGVSSMCGSSNVLEYLGVKFTNDKSVLEKQIEKTGITFLHAPLFHPALKNLAPIRKELGVKTFFNVLGPMVNPSKPKNQIVGVYSLELLRLYTYIYQKTDKNFLIIHSLDGFDEVSLTSDFKISGNKGEHILRPNDLGYNYLKISDLSGGVSIEDSAKILVDIISNKGTKAQNEVIIANAGLSIYCANPNKSMTDSIALAKESLESGKAYQVYKNFMALMN
ncbi:MAG: anthranilate phosphoribosyltransferase [Bacteroidota bacterium]|nr:anthranilate phosphoribosyltransferase [Bacteroidota bacterium]